MSTSGWKGWQGEGLAGVKKRVLSLRVLRTFFETFALVPTCARAPRTHAHHQRRREVLGFHLGAFSFSETVVVVAPAFIAEARQSGECARFPVVFPIAGWPMDRETPRGRQRCLPSAKPKGERESGGGRESSDRGDAVVRRVPAESPDRARYSSPVPVRAHLRAHGSYFAVFIIYIVNFYTYTGQRYRLFSSYCSTESSILITGPCCSADCCWLLVCSPDLLFPLL